MTTRYYLLIYDRGARRLVRRDEFTDVALATAEYDRVEREHLADEAVEIVLLGADSLDTLKRTHGHYFGEPAETNRAGRATGVATAAVRAALGGAH